MTDTAFEDRFWRKVDLLNPTGCWEWKASVGSHGYGQINKDGRPVLAHRVAYEFLRGDKADSLDHRICRNKRCCNPDHLVDGSRGDNIRQPDHHVGQNLLKTHCPKGHPYSGSNLYVTAKGHRQCAACRDARNKSRWRAEI